MSDDFMFSIRKRQHQLRVREGSSMFEEKEGMK